MTAEFLALAIYESAMKASENSHAWMGDFQISPSLPSDDPDDVILYTVTMDGSFDLRVMAEDLAKRIGIKLD